MMAAAFVQSGAQAQTQPSSAAFVLGDITSDISLEEIASRVMKVSSSDGNGGDVTGRAAESYRSHCGAVPNLSIIHRDAVKILDRWHLRRAYDSQIGNKLTIFTLATPTNSRVQLYYFSVLIDGCASGADCAVTVQSSKVTARMNDGVVRMSIASYGNDEISGDLIDSTTISLRTCT